MITFTKKTTPAQEPSKGQDNRFEQIRKTAKEQHKASDADAALRRKAAQEDRLV